MQKRRGKAQFPLERHDLSVTFPRGLVGDVDRQLVGDKLATCYGQVANLLTASAVGDTTCHVTTLIVVIH